MSSGAKSDKYFDIKSLLGHKSDNQLLYSELKNYAATMALKYDCLGGTELGGALMVSGWIASVYTHWGLSSCYIRKQQRIHGLKKMIEGHPISPILLVDDVISTGKTISEAAWTCVNEGWGPPCGVLCVIDRMTEQERLSLNVQPVYSLFKESDFD